jgi:ribosome biogenesis GTPase
MRELGVWDAGAGIERAFADIDALAGDCRFRDCSHDGEPGCAVAAAVAPERLAAWRKLAREQAWVDGRKDGQAARDRKQQWKAIHKAMKVRMRHDPKLRED